MAALGLGTYLQTSAELMSVLVRARDLDFRLIDTSSNYGDGVTQLLVGNFIRSNPSWRPTVITKVGFVSARMIESGHAPPEISGEIIHKQCFAPSYISWQAERAKRELGRVDAFLLHNPERLSEYIPKRAFDDVIERAFGTLESLQQGGQISSYGIATWDQSEHLAWNTAAYWIDRARVIVGPNNGFRYFQHPVNLIHLRAFKQIGDEVSGDIAHCKAGGVDVVASSALAGGQLAKLVDRELAERISPGATPVQACLASVLAVPGLDWVLVGPRSEQQLNELFAASQRMPVPIELLAELTELLS